MSSDVTIGKGKLAGKGVYAAHDFKKGGLVMAWNLTELTQEEFDALPKSEHMFVHTFWDRIFLFPEPSRYINHSPNPNTHSDFDRQCDFASRPIKKGEMITINSRIEVGFELRSFLNVYEKAAVKNFKWLKGGYRNAVVTYTLTNGTEKTLTLKRLRGKWRIV
jgi:hypothetical protein